MSICQMEQIFQPKSYTYKSTLKLLWCLRIYCSWGLGKKARFALLSIADKLELICYELNFAWFIKLMSMLANYISPYNHF